MVRRSHLSLEEQVGRVVGAEEQRGYRHICYFKDIGGRRGVLGVGGCPLPEHPNLLVEISELGI